MNSYEFISRFINHQAGKMLSYIRQTHNVPKVRVINCFSPRRRISLGGWKNQQPFIRLVVAPYVKSYEQSSLLNVFEYEHYRNDSVIGELKGVSWSKGLTALIAHELAHVVHLMPGTVLLEPTVRYGGQSHGRHGWQWQTLYADLRKEFVNGLGCMPDPEGKYFFRKP